MQQQQSGVLEGLWKAYQANAEWIRATDTKAGAVLAAAGVLVGVVASAVKDNRADILRNPVLGNCVVLGTTLLVLSVVYGVNCISPTLGFRRKRGLARSVTEFQDAKESVIYFEHVASLERPDDYALIAGEVFTHPEKAQAQVAQQVWALARVCSEKNRQVAWSIRLLALSLAFFALAVLVGFVGGKP